MLKWYGYLGVVLVLIAEANFALKIEPFADWYIVIVWAGYLLFVDSLVYMARKESLITKYPKEFAFMLALSLPFWLIFESYNLFTLSWTYVNYPWYVHPFDYLTIMPAILETFTLVRALGIGQGLDRKIGALRRRAGGRPHKMAIGLLVVVGAISALLPVFLHGYGFFFMWIGLFLLLDPLNYLMKRPSIVRMVSAGKKSVLLQLFLSGIIMGFFWEFWNYQALPKWQYNLPYSLPGLRLFAMPVLGYSGYLPFALETFLFFALFRSFVFKKKNDVLGM